MQKEIKGTNLIRILFMTRKTIGKEKKIGTTYFLEIKEGPGPSQARAPPGHGFDKELLEIPVWIFKKDLNGV